jgi:hypothetical protein
MTAPLFTLVGSRPIFLQMLTTATGTLIEGKFRNAGIWLPPGTSLAGLSARLADTALMGERKGTAEHPTCRKPQSETGKSRFIKGNVGETGGIHKPETAISLEVAERETIMETKLFSSAQRYLSVLAIVLCVALFAIPRDVFASQGPLDGKTFVVETGEKGKSGEDKDTLTFKDGNFHYHENRIFCI